jgi:tetratricopeptide (TPR) repeat protein
MLEEACRFYEQALAEKPEFWEASLNLGHALSALGREKEALAHWRRALQLKPELAAGYFSGTGT